MVLHGVDSIANEVGEHLANFAVVGNDGRGVAEAAFNGNSQRTEFAFPQSENGLKQLVNVGFDRPRVLPVEAQSLRSDMHDALEFALR